MLTKITTVYANLAKYMKLPDWTTVFIWIFGTVILAGLTVMDFLPLVNEYTNNNVATHIVVKMNEQVKRPNVTICTFYYSNALDNVAQWAAAGQKNNDGCEECEAMTEHGWEIWKNITFPVVPRGELGANMLKNTLGNEIVNEVLEKNLEAKVLVLNRSNFNWNQPIVDAFWTFFSCVNAWDMAALTGSTKGLFSVFCAGFNLTAMETLPNERIDNLYRLLIESFEVYSRGWPAFYSDHYSYGRLGTPIRVADREEFVVKGNYACFALLQNSSAEYFVYEAFPDSHRPPWMPRTKKQSVYINQDNSVLYGIGNPFNNLYSTDQNDVERLSREEAKFAYEVDVRVVEGRSYRACSKESVSRIYYVKKLLADFVTFCKCIPFCYRNLYAGNNPDLPYCTSKMYENCQQEAIANSRTYQAECDDKCQHVHFRWTSGSNALDDTSRNFTGFVAIQRTENPFLEFSLVVRDTPEKFLAQMGGLVNFYLGFSGLSLCAAVIFFIDLFKKWKKQSRPDEKKEPRPGASIAMVHASPNQEMAEDIKRLIREISGVRNGLELACARIAELEMRLH